MIGNLLGGRYQVVKILAAGGFGQTYITQDTHRPGHPECVLKHLKPSSNNSKWLKNARRLFQSEAEALEKLGTHDQIPRLLAYFEENQEFYLVQEFIAGQPFSTQLLSGQRWSESQVCQLLEDILGILVFVHSQGVIHRDIKPNNLILREQDNKLVLVDFGSVKQALSQAIATSGESNVSFSGISSTIGIGTPGYMPIEQALGRPRANSDIYSLGIIGIQALTGISPREFQEDENTGEILWQHQAQVSDALAFILTKMVRYHFKDRYQSAAEVLEALKPVISSPESAQLNSAPRATLVQHLNTAQSSSSSSQPPHSGNQPHTNLVSLAHTSATEINSEASSAINSTAPNPVEAETIVYPPQALSPFKSQASSASPNIISASAQTNSSLTPVNLQRNNHGILRLGAGIVAVLGLAFGYAMYLQPRAGIQPTVQLIQTLKATGKYQECINQASTIPKNSRFYNYAQTLLHQCHLGAARDLAAEGYFSAAIAQALKIPQNSNTYQDAQLLVSQWSEKLLELATNQQQSGQSNDAITIAQAIPNASPVYNKTQNLIKQWNGNKANKSSRLRTNQKVINRSSWQRAISKAKKIVATSPTRKAPSRSKIAVKTASTRKSTSSTLKRITLKRTVKPAIRTPKRVTPKRTVSKSPKRVTSKRVIVRRTTTKRTIVRRTTTKRITRVSHKRLKISRTKRLVRLSSNRPRPVANQWHKLVNRRRGE